MLGLKSAILNKPRASLCLLEVAFLLRLILHGGSGLDPSNAIKQNGRPTQRCSCSRKSPPPFNPPIQPIQPIQPVNSLPLPSKFEGANKPNRHFERYRIASGLQNKSNQGEVGAFLYVMGDCADDIVKTLSINEATAAFDEVKTALNGYFAARRNVIVERTRFNRRRQNPGEKVDTFIQDLYRLTENCECPVATRC